MKKIIPLFLIVLSIVVLIIGTHHYNQKVKLAGEKAFAAAQGEKKEEAKAFAAKVKNAKENVSQLISESTIKALNIEHIPTKAIEKLDKGESATIVFLGDSTTEQNIQTNGKSGHVNLIEQFLNETYGSKLVHVSNAGVSGNTIVDMEKRVQNVIDLNPDLVIINSGLNDATPSRDVSDANYKEKYKSLINQIMSKTNAQIILRTSNKVISPESVNTRLRYNLNPIVQNLATEYKTGYIDLYTYYDYLITTQGIDLKSINNDNYHPNEKGQKIIADLLLYTLL